jgi:nucleoside-diphosphate-sugar epimerase
MTSLVTGATGFLGSHIAERLVQRGEQVRCLVRPTSNTSFLETLPVHLVHGDITDSPSLLAAMEGVDTVYHAAALVSDWAPWSAFRSVTINGTRNMLKAAGTANVRRFLHVSTDGVYRFKDLTSGVNENSPLETDFGWLDYYRRAKTAAEKIAQHSHRTGRIAVSIVRPALILGERDGAMLPALAAFIKSRSAAVMGNGKNRLPTVYAGDVAELCILASASPGAVGEVYNAVHPEYVTQNELYQTLAAATGLKAPSRHIPLRALYALAFAMEVRARMSGWEKRPELTRFSVNLVGLDYQEDCSKALNELGWSPAVTMPEAVRRSVEWTQARRAAAVSR